MPPNRKSLRNVRPTKKLLQSRTDEVFGSLLRDSTCYLTHMVQDSTCEDDSENDENDVYIVSDFLHGLSNLN